VGAVGEKSSLMAAFTYSPRRGQYRDVETGKWVSDAIVRAEIDRLADAAAGRLARLTERLRQGDLTLAAWQAEAMRIVKMSHVAAGVIAQGGKAQMTPSAYGFLGSEIRAQYAYLRDLANAIAEGAVPLDGRLVARAGMYGQHARVTFTAAYARGQAVRGYVSERNVLGSAEHCAECQSLSDRGWVAIGTLPPPGSRTCLSHCHCRLAYSMVEAAA
jgi:hypothetical protein